MRETGPVRIALSGDERAAQGLIAYARTQLGIMKNLMRLGGIKFLTRTLTGEHGETIRLTANGGVDTVQINVPVRAAAAAAAAEAAIAATVPPQVEPVKPLHVVVLGISTEGWIQPFRWSSQHRTTVLLPLPDGYPTAEPTGMSEDGSVMLGVVYDDDGNYTAALWHWNETAQTATVEVLSGYGSLYADLWPLQLSADGTVILGYSEISEGAAATVQTTLGFDVHGVRTCTHAELAGPGALGFDFYGTRQFMAGDGRRVVNTAFSSLDTDRADFVYLATPGVPARPATLTTPAIPAIPSAAVGLPVDPATLEWPIVGRSFPVTDVEATGINYHGSVVCGTYGRLINQGEVVQIVHDGGDDNYSLYTDSATQEAYYSQINFNGGATNYYSAMGIDSPYTLYSFQSNPAYMPMPPDGTPPSWFTPPGVKNEAGDFIPTSDAPPVFGWFETIPTSLVGATGRNGIWTILHNTGSGESWYFEDISGEEPSFFDWLLEVNDYDGGTYSKYESVSDIDGDGNFYRYWSLVESSGLGFFEATPPFWTTSGYRGWSANYYEPQPRDTACVWSNGTFAPLPLPPGVPDGDPFVAYDNPRTSAAAIASRANAVVGNLQQFYPLFRYVAFIWHATSGSRILRPLPGRSTTRADLISQHGAAVVGGAASTPFDTYVPCLWTRGKPRDMSALWPANPYVVAVTEVPRTTV